MTFTSSSTVDHFFNKLTADERARVSERAVLASIGPSTTKTIRKREREPDVVAKNASVQALHDAVVVAVQRAEKVLPPRDPSPSAQDDKAVVSS